MENVTDRISYLLLVICACAFSLEMPGSCKTGEYYEPAVLACQACPANTSMVTSTDGFGCSCEENSIPIGISRCKRCNSTEVLSSDGRACVPRRCQSGGGRTVCRKCPGDYITVTQNLDGSIMKEMICMKCARGFKVVNNACVRCESCACDKQETVIRGRCVPKKYIDGRPKHEDTKIHPYEWLDVVKDEYFCTNPIISTTSQYEINPQEVLRLICFRRKPKPTLEPEQNDLRSCRRLADQCVKSFYSTDLSGPCRLWIQSKITQPHGLPPLTLEPSNDKTSGEITLTKGMDIIKIAQVVYTSSGGVRIESEESLKQAPETCFLPLEIKVGINYLHDCKINISNLGPYMNETVAPFLYINKELKPLSVNVQKPDGSTVQKGTWPGSFRRYFLINNRLSATTNTTSTVYLRTILIKIQIQRGKSKRSALKLAVSVDVKFATKSPLSQTVTMTIIVDNEMPSAGIIRGLEIWGGVLGALLSLYAVVQWRGVLRRGGLHYSLVPLLAGCVSDALYFTVLFSTLHALAAEAGTLKMTLPLSRYEEYMIQAFVYSAIVLKVIKIIWINWNQCHCDIFFIDWSEYNPSEKEALEPAKSEEWKKNTLAREWNRFQTKRRSSPGYTACLTLVILNFTLSWQSSLPHNQGYNWAVVTSIWWCSYIALITTRWIIERLFGSPAHFLPQICNSLGLSLLVFQEEYYAHYVHGRNDDDIDARSITAALASCRIVCVPQLRIVYKQLSTPGLVGLDEADKRQVLLSRFLAAFIERALDGVSWVANERTILERLLDVELVDRESGSTSVLLYDKDDKTPSCFSMTWWGHEWTLGTFDAMVFGVIFIASGNSSWALLGTITMWQIMKNIRSSLGIKNQKEKTEL